MACLKKKGSASSVFQEIDGNIYFYQKINAGIFRDFYSNLASDLVKQLPNATSKYDMNYVRYYYSGIELLGGLFVFSHVCVSEIMNILDNFDTNKAAGIYGLSCIFIKVGGKNTVLTNLRSYKSLYLTIICSRIL